MRPPLIAIDGPAGAGKSSTSRTVALRLGVPYLDTGAMYRAATWSVIKNNVNIKVRREIERLINNYKMTMIEGEHGLRIWVDHREVTSDLRSQELTNMIGPVCEIPEVRYWLVSLQRRWAERGFGVMEGRDIGTVVLPGAGLKIFLTATPEERARRRAKDIGIDLDSDALLKLADEIAERDLRDSTRQDSPLKPAKDAITINTSDLTFNAQVEKIIDLAANRFDLKIYR